MTKGLAQRKIVVGAEAGSCNPRAGEAGLGIEFDAYEVIQQGAESDRSAFQIAQDLERLRLIQTEVQSCGDKGVVAARIQKLMDDFCVSQVEEEEATWCDTRAVFRGVALGLDKRDGE